MDITGTGDPGGVHAFEAPASIAGGLTRINFTNAAAQEDHLAVFIRLNDDATPEDHDAILETAEAEAEVEAVGSLSAAVRDRRR